MPYDASKDPYKDAPTRQDFGRSCRTENIKSDSADLNPYAKAVQLTSSGTLKVLPAGNPDNKPVTYDTLPAGFVTPFMVRRIYATGTTAGVITVDDE